MKISKNGKIRILIYKKSYPLPWIRLSLTSQIRVEMNRGLKILNWTKDRVRAHFKGLLITNTLLKF